MFAKRTFRLSDLRQEVTDLRRVIETIEQYDESVISLLVDEYGADKEKIDTQLVEERVTTYIIGCKNRDEFVRPPTEFLENWINKMTDYGLRRVGLSEKSMDNKSKSGCREVVIVRPEDSKTETIAWLNVNGDEISVSFPEKREDFRRITKDFGLKWDGKAESRIIDNWAGDPIDRAAELGHKLLANGFTVVFPDERIQEMAIAGDYEPECRRWILVKKGGQYDNWFVLSWSYSEDCYNAAKEVSGSRYDKPHVVVPPEQFAEVIDFAKIHRFRFSQAALALVVQAKAMLESALLVSVEQREDIDYDLNIPELEWENDDLADDISFDVSPDTAA